MSERNRRGETPALRWQAVSDGVAAGYERDAVAGDWRLAGLVMYPPSTDKLRGIRMRTLETATTAQLLGALRQDAPPTRDELAALWDKRALLLGIVTELADKSQRLADAVLAEHLADALARADRLCAPELLRRHDDDAPGDFYRRMAKAHHALALVTSKPTTELARRAGVPVGSAAGWVSRARAQGMYPTEDGDDDGS